MNVLNFVGKAIGTAALVAGLVAPVAADEIFTVDESPYGGGQVVADKLNGGYVERISFNGAGGFATTAVADFGLFFLGGSTVSSVLETSYKLYAVFTDTGTVTPLAGGLFSFAGGNGSFNLYLDVNSNTTKALGASGSDPVALGNNADDLLLASAANMTSSSGLLVAGVGGFYDLVFDDFTLTTDGEAYFINPSPFYMRVNVDGDFDTFNPAGDLTIRGDVSAVFLPEPTSIALVGLALVGLGLSSRRKQ